jgi:hypothetical protein
MLELVFEAEFPNYDDSGFMLGTLFVSKNGKQSYSKWLAFSSWGVEIQLEVVDEEHIRQWLENEYKTSNITFDYTASGFRELTNYAD